MSMTLATDTMLLAWRCRMFRRVAMAAGIQGTYNEATQTIPARWDISWYFGRDELGRDRGQGIYLNCDLKTLIGTEAVERGGYVSSYSDVASA